MLTRIWNYHTAWENVTAFETFEQNFGLPMVSGQPGCLGVELVRRKPEGGQAPAQAEYCMISHWESYDYLQEALASQTWKEEIELFLAQGFGEGNGVTLVYDLVASANPPS
jgi:quinol monooxygenase YgiN